MSQFLICKTEYDLSQYGTTIKNVTENKDLYLRVVNQYINGANIDNIWVIDQIYDIVNQIDDNILIIEEISKNCELMIFWYSSDFDELDFVNSQSKLIDYLKSKIDNPCPEIYLYAQLHKGQREV